MRHPSCDHGHEGECEPGCPCLCELTPPPDNGPETMRRCRNCAGVHAWDWMCTDEEQIAGLRARVAELTTELRSAEAEVKRYDDEVAAQINDATVYGHGRGMVDQRLDCASHGCMYCSEQIKKLRAL